MQATPAASELLRSLGIDEAFDGWKVETAQRAGVDVAVVLSKGPEIHFVALDTRRSAMSRRNTVQFLKPILEEHGYATTRVPVATTDHRLRETLGFTPTWADERFTYWALTELPFQKERHHGR